MWDQCLIAVAGVLLSASAASGQAVYEWIGSYGTGSNDGTQFSDGANWAGGVAPPIDGDYILRHGFGGDQSGYATYLDWFQQSGYRSSGEAARIDGLVASGNVQLEGAFLLSGANVTGGLTVPIQTYAGFYTDGFNGPSTTSSTVGFDSIDGELDFSSNALSTPGPLDLSNGQLSLRGIPIAIEQDTVVVSRYEGDLILGDWRLDGFPAYNPGVNERLDVTGLLNLEQSNLVDAPLGRGLDLRIDEVITDDDVPAYFTLASYGNRVGSLPESSLGWSIESWSSDPDFSYEYRSGVGQIVYTSGENAGPGEIRVLTPEPATLGFGLIAAGVLMVRRR